MRKINTIDRFSFFLEHVGWPIVVMIWFRNAVFIELGQLTLQQSKMLLWIMVIVLTSAGFLLTCNQRRNHISLIVTIALPYELYFLLTYAQYLRQKIVMTAAIAAVLATAYAALAVCRRIHDPSRKKEIIGRRMKQAGFGAGTVVSLCFLVMIIPVSFDLWFGNGMYDTGVESVESAEEASEWTVENKMETVRLLQEDQWKQLSEQEKMDVLGTIINIEINKFGLDHELYLEAAILEGNTLGHYENANYRIMVDVEHLQTGTAEAVLNTICHECYHSYTYMLCDLYLALPEQYRRMQMFRNIPVCIEELESAVGPEDDFDTYWNSLVERSARSYAQSATAEYYDLIAAEEGADEN